MTVASMRAQIAVLHAAGTQLDHYTVALFCCDAAVLLPVEVVCCKHQLSINSDICNGVYTSQKEHNLVL